MEFSKYHGAGNDFIVIHPTSVPIGVDLVALSRAICNRRYGIGADGVLISEESQIADAKMRILNPDGSEAEMCGNGIRCFAKYAYDNGIVRTKEMNIETLAGVKNVKILEGEMVLVEMGEPLFDREDIPANGEGKFIEHPLEGLTVSALNMGVPHAIVFSEDLSSVDVKKLGKTIRLNETFPKGINVDFAAQIGKNTFKVRTYERGVEDETNACGTGVAASVALAVVLGKAKANEPISVDTKGGSYNVWVKTEGDKITQVTLGGPVAHVFDGKVDLGNLVG
ncbi:MAG: diaminopimelate epimerase [Desulfatiglandales bacterium]